MKRISNEQINHLIKDHLKRRNYSETNISSVTAKSNRTKSRICSLPEMAIKGSVMKSESVRDVIALSASVGDFGVSAENAFRHFLNYVSQLKCESIAQQLKQLYYPIFIYIFIELLESGHVFIARRFFREHKSKFNDWPQNRIIDSINNSLNSNIIDANLMSFKTCKYCVQLSSDCLKQMQIYSEKVNDLIITQILNTCFDINIYSSDNQIESERRNESLISPFDGSESVSPNVKPFDSNTTTSDEQSLLSAIAKVAKLEPCVPSLCLFTIESSNLSCVSVRDDMKQVVGGFQNSTINLWNFCSNDFYDSQSLIQVKRKSSDISLNIIDHNIKDEDNNDLNNDLPLNSCEQSMTVLRGHSGPIYGLTFLKGTNLLLSCSCDTTVRAWDTISCNNVALFNAHLYPVWAIDSSVLGNYFVTGCKDSVSYLWSIERSFPLRQYCGHNMEVDCVRFHPNSAYFATGSGDKEIKMWDIQQARAVRTFVGHEGSVYSLAFSSCGKYLASAGEDRKVKLWDIASGHLIKDYCGHSDTVRSLGFNYNNSILVSSSADQTLKLWNLKNVTTNSNHFSKSDNSDNNRNQSASGILVSYKTEPNNVIHSQFMAHNLLLSFATKKP